MKEKKSTKKFIKSKLKKELEVRKLRKENSFVPRKKSSASPAVVANDNSSSNDDDDDDDDENNIAGFVDSKVNLHQLSKITGIEDEEDVDDEDVRDEDDIDSESEIDEAETLEQLKNLKSTDPKFFDFLQQNDKELLETDDTNEVLTNQIFDDIPTSKSSKQVSKESIKLFVYQIKQNSSLKALQKLLKLFKEAANFNESLGSEFVLIITSCLKYARGVLDSQLGHDPAQSKKWKKLKQTVKKFLTNILQLLKNTTSESIKKFILQRSQDLIKYFVTFPKLMKELIVQLISIFKTESEILKTNSFLLIRKISIEYPNPWLDLSFKLMFQAYMDASKLSSIHSWPSIIFMSKCMVEIGGLSLPLTYQHSFVYLRQLAIKIRSCSSGGDYKLVYNWQVYHCCRLWCELLATYCSEGVGKDSEVLEPLIYPLVQLMVGVIRLKPSSKHFPLRLSILKLLIKLSTKTKTFIPIVSYLLEMFESTELKQKPKPSTLKPLDFIYNIRAPNQYLGTKTYHQGLVDQIIAQLYDYFTTQATSIAFPELIIPTIIQLRRMAKQGREYGLSKSISTLVDKLEQNSRFVEARRNLVTFGPCDITASAAFMKGEETPLSKFNNARLIAVERAVPRDTLVVDDDSSDEEVERVAKRKNKKVGGGKRLAVDVQGDDDLLEEFELSDDE